MHAQLTHSRGILCLCYIVSLLITLWWMVFVSHHIESILKHDIWKLYVGTIDGLPMGLNTCTHIYLSAYCSSLSISWSRDPTVASFDIILRKDVNKIFTHYHECLGPENACVSASRAWSMLYKYIKLFYSVSHLRMTPMSEIDS